MKALMPEGIIGTNFWLSVPLGISLSSESHLAQAHASSQGDPQLITWLIKQGTQKTGHLDSTLNKFKGLLHSHPPSWVKPFQAPSLYVCMARTTLQAPSISSQYCFCLLSSPSHGCCPQNHSLINILSLTFVSRSASWETNLQQHSLQMGNLSWAGLELN
jgi:hypothetical protein